MVQASVVPLIGPLSQLQFWAKAGTAAKTKQRIVSEAIRILLSPPSNRNFLLGLKNGTIVHPSRLFATPLNDLSSGALATDFGCPFRVRVQRTQASPLHC